MRRRPWRRAARALGLARGPHGRHPHVVELLGTGSAGGCSFVAMELLDGRTLSAQITLGGPLSLDAAALTLRHAACALEHVHAAGIVHRDIKPQNLFVCGSGPTARVKLIDFGLATERAAAAASPARSHRPSQIAGSLAFMSPDDRLGLSLPDVQSDLWALAVTAYVLLTKRLPFRARSGEIGRHCPLASRFELPSHHRADIPQTIDDWFERAFSRDRSARFRSALDASGAFCRAIAAERLIASSARHCLSDDEILAFCAGAMSPAAVRLADAHCGACEACSEVLSAIAGCSETPDEPVTPTRLESTRPHGGRGLSGEATERRAPTLRCVPRGRARAPTPLLLLDR